MSKRSKRASDSTASDAATSTLPSDVTEPASTSALTESIAPASVEGATPSTAPKKKRKKKPGTRKSKAPPNNGTLDLTPSTAAPPVVEVAPQTEVDPDDISVPPAEDLDHDFFRASAAPPSVGGASRALHDIEPIVEETRDPRIQQLMTAEAKRRRAHFTKYVKAAVAISIVLCIAAIIRVGIRRNHGDENTAMAATSERPTPVVVVPEAPKAKPVDPPLPPEGTAAAAAEEPVAAALAAPSASAEPAASHVEEPAPSAPAVASAAPEPAPSASAEPTEIDPKMAAKEKRLSQQSLDQGKIKDSIEHGELSVRYDPADAEAWLILGAAYQMKGDHKEARRCFRSCISEGKRGPKGECMAMPH